MTLEFKLLVANRGEIAIRILGSARELGWSTVAIYTENDESHASFADETIKLVNVEDFMNVETIASIAERSNCTHLHPGYGFLSENPLLPLALAKTGSVVFIGPSPEALRISGDKMLSRDLATSLGVNIAIGQRVQSTVDVHAFVQRRGYPIMIKALDGGGGRGIRVVSSESGLDEAYQRCLGESPSKQVFVERALAGPGWKHIEVQIIGDGVSACHFWERECSVQRRFQKIVEMAPSNLSRQAVQPLIDASLKLANHLKYKGLGTFEYLFNAQSHEWVFLEINPRVQVEHTITEEITDTDLVRTQLLLFTAGHSLSSLNVGTPLVPPTTYAIQLRLTAEDPKRSFRLSAGTIAPSDMFWPAGRGIRVDTWLKAGPYSKKSVTIRDWTIGTDFDSLIAKLIVRGRSFDEVTAKAVRALGETSIGDGTIKTNISVLAGVMKHPDWLSNTIDTLWLERNLAEVLNLGDSYMSGLAGRPTSGAHKDTAPTSAAGASILLQPGTLFNLTISPVGGASSSESSQATMKHSLTLNTIGQNAFPSVLSGVIQTSLSPAPMEFSLTQSTSAIVSSGTFEFADLNDTSHVPSPMTGKIVELHPALSASSGTQNAVRKGEPLLIITVMKMENVVLAPFDGVVERVGKGIKTGMVLGEGMVVCVLNGKVPFSRL